MSGLNTAGQQNNVQSTEKDWQIARKLEKIARDIEYTIINGVYQEKRTVQQPQIRLAAFWHFAAEKRGAKIDGRVRL